MTSWIVCVVARSGSDPAALGGLIPLLQPGRDVQREAKRSFRRIAADLVRLVAASRLVRTDCKHSRITEQPEVIRGQKSRCGKLEAPFGVSRLRADHAALKSNPPGRITL